MQPGGYARLGANPEFQALRRQVETIQRRLGIVAPAVNAGPSVAAGTVAKRFRIAVFVTPLVQAGGTIAGTVKWSMPMPSSVYNVDAACSAMSAVGIQSTVTNQTAEGCTVSFVTPALMQPGSVVIVLGVSPAVIS